VTALEIIMSHKRASIVGVLARLGVADVVGGGGATVEEIARRTEPPCRAEAVYRLLRAAQSFGFFDVCEPARNFDEAGGRRFDRVAVSNNAFSNTLRRSSSNSVYYAAVWHTDYNIKVGSAHCPRLHPPRARS
jgi:hypothetical protein